MSDIIAINKNISKLAIPFKDVFTTVFAVKTQEGALLFDSATYDEDADNYIIPALKELGIDGKNLKYIFLSHSHRDHAGSLGRLLQYFPDVTVLSRSVSLKEKYVGYDVCFPDDGEAVLGDFEAVALPGHSEDCMALLDKRSGTLITGDSLQEYGLFGEQEWGAIIRHPEKYLASIEKVRKLGVEEIYTAHDYYPCGAVVRGKAEIEKLLDSCIKPIEIIRKLIEENPLKSDKEIKELYNSEKVPKISEKVITAVREMIK